MRNEVLRMERVTYKEDEVVKLEDFNLQIFQGEIMGFIPSMTVIFIMEGKR